MKTKYYLLDFFEFFLLFFAFIVPALLTKPQSNIVLNVSYQPITILIQILIIIYLLMRMYDIGISFRKQPIFSYSVLVKDIKNSAIIYACLIIIGLSSNFFDSVLALSNNELIAIPPNSNMSWVWFIFSVITLACFEEVVFRQFLPEKLLYFLRLIPKYKDVPLKYKSKIQLGVELLIIILFAMGHRYLGLFGILSAFFSGVILRISIIKTHTIVPACIAHSINNIVSFIVVFYFI